MVFEEHLLTEFFKYTNESVVCFKNCVYTHTHTHTHTHAYICMYIYKLKVAHWILPGGPKVVIVGKINEVVHEFCANNAIKQIVSFVSAKVSG